ncbi:MAG: DUF5667 domain-containing protein [Candidatus Aminicenantia bacterium]
MNRKALMMFIILSLGGIILAQERLVGNGSEENTEKEIHQRLINRLIEKSVKIDLTDDSIKRAELFNEMATDLVEATNELSKKNRIKEAENMASLYSKIVEKGIFGNLSRVKDFRKKGTKNAYERILKATQKHEEVLRRVLEKVPEPGKKGILRALEVSKRGRMKALENMKRKGKPNWAGPSKNKGKGKEGKDYRKKKKRDK